MVQRKLELENKLMSLQAKKEKMDSLLSTLKASRDTMAGICELIILFDFQFADAICMQNAAGFFLENSEYFLNCGLEILN